jgi:DNA helicase-2/ATP-dependent DNA helicase PcrA
MVFEDYKAIADELGMEITKFNDQEDNVYGDKDGDQAMNIHALSRLKMISLEQEWAQAEKTTQIRFPVVEQWATHVENYKKKYAKHDFTDMLENYSGALPVKVFIVDEAQDLSKLQWWVVQQAMAEAEKIYLAGDDDQCIFNFSGAHVDGFLGHKVDSDIVLPSSYRVPKKVFKLANSVAIIRCFPATKSESA